MTESPKLAQIISLILKSYQIEDIEPNVINQLLEFASRYTNDVLHDAILYSEHAGKNSVDLTDIKLGIQGRVNYSFSVPPPKEFLVELAHQKNKQPLPPVYEKYGIHLPKPKYCLTELNYTMVPEVSSQAAPTSATANTSTTANNTTAKNDAPNTPTTDNSSKPDTIAALSQEPKANSQPPVAAEVKKEE
jgi:transcription initiation factor TFIID subunit 9B